MSRLSLKIKLLIGVTSPSYNPDLVVITGLIVDDQRELQSPDIVIRWIFIHREESVQLFETERLIGRHLSHQDLHDLTEILSDPEVMKYSVRGVCDEETTRNFIHWCLESYSTHGVGPWALIEKSTSELIGFCGVGPEIVDGIEEMNLGYRLARKSWNRGLATEAVRAALEYVFTQHSLASVIAIIEPENSASIRVSEKAGFKDYSVHVFHNRPVRLYRISHEVQSPTHVWR